MSTPIHRRASRHHLGPLAAAAVVLAAVTACGDDDSSPDVSTGPAEIDQLGAEEPRVQLPGTGALGQTGSGAANIRLDLVVEGGGVSESVPVEIEIGYDAVIVDATEESYVAETTITGSEMADVPAGADTGDLEGLVGVTYRQEFAADGTAGQFELVNADDITSAQQTAFDELGASLGAATVAYPSEPIGVGARWSSVATIESEGFETDVTYRYELTELDGDDYVVTIDYDEDIDESIDVDGQSADVSGTISGGGTATGNVTSPLAAQVLVDQQTALAFDADGATYSMTMDLVVETSAAPG